MAHYVSLDVSVRHTSICIVDDVGKVVREARVTSEPEAIIRIVTAQHLTCRRIGLEAGPCHSGCSMRSHLLVFQ